MSSSRDGIMMEFTVTVKGTGSLGLAFVITDACMAALAKDPVPTGRIAIENPTVQLKKGDVLAIANEHAFTAVSGCDADNDGMVDVGEIVAAMATTNLRKAFLAQRTDLGVLADTLNDEALAALVLEQYDVDGSGKIDGDEKAGFLQLMLSSTIQKVGSLARPLTLTFRRPEAAAVGEKKGEDGNTATYDAEVDFTGMYFISFYYD